MDRYSSIVKQRNNDTFSEEQIKNMRLISFEQGKEAIPFGSVVYRAQPFAADIDTFQLFRGCCSIDETVKVFEKELIRVTKDILSHKDRLITEFKAGLDQRYDIDIGPMVNSIYFPNENVIRKNVDEYHKKGLFNDIERMAIVNALNSQLSGQDKYDAIYFTYRNRRIVRWSTEEILKGYKMLAGDYKMTLHEALKAKSFVKIDMIAFIDGKYTEVTNFVIMYYLKEDGTREMVNLSFDFLDKRQLSHSFDKQMKEEIEKLYFSNMYYSPFKCIKRMWTYARHFHLREVVLEYLDLATGQISNLYQIKSQVEAILMLGKNEDFKKSKMFYSNINKQINGFKNEITHITLIDNTQIDILMDLIDKIINEHDINYKLDELKQLNGVLKYAINYLSVEGLIELRSNPPPAFFYPKVMKYAARARKPSERPINPLDVLIP